MRRFTSIFIALIGLSLIAVDAEARRMSGGKNIGKQREAISPSPSPSQATPRTPAQQPVQKAAPAAQQAAPAAPPPKPSGMSKWLGPLAGLAIGAGLASLFLNNGMGGALMGILLMLALVAGAVMLFRLFRGGRAPTQEPLRYAGAGAHGGIEPVRAPAPAPLPAAAPVTGTAAPHSVAAATQSGTSSVTTAPAIADFDSEQFVRHARTNFINLQAAHDRKDLSTIRDVLTPDLYREIEAEVLASGDAPQKTEIVTLNAEVIDVAAEGALYVVSVRFSGLIRETAGAEAQPFSEVWHLEKSASGRSGWLVSGIQQT